MPKQTILGGIILIVLVGIVFMLIPEKDVPADKTLPVVATESGTETSQTLKELLAERTRMQCTFAGDVGEMRISGTVYVGDEKIRGDYTMTGALVQNGMETHMIMNPTSMWYWTDISTQGFKASLDPKTLEPKKKDPSRVVNYNQDFDYTCAPWIVDASKFIPPSTISFTDLDTPVTGASSNTLTGSNAQQCAACDLVPDASGKAQCRAALQCN